MANIMDMLMAGGSPGGAVPPDAGGPMGAPSSPVMGGQGDTADTGDTGGLPQRYRDLLDEVMSVLQVEPDPEDKAELSQILARLQKLIARNHADTQAVLGGNSSLSRVLSKAG